MCGIFGMVTRGAPLPAEILERATQSLTHRGPDDGGTILLRDTDDDSIEVGLGNRRLAILDLSPLGHQPMNDPATGNWIVYNGEVYNFREVRAKLEREGAHFTSHSDTEVILKAYGRWGEQCLDHFRGMFAFAIWDAHRHRLFVARDPIGIKPLYYFQSPQHFIFSSEVRTLLGTGIVPRQIDPAGLTNYLTFGSLYDPNTLIENVHALPPGCYLTWERGQLKQVQYWTLIDPNPIETGPSASIAKNQSQVVGEISDLLDESVRLQLVSDVPVGVFLSGGIDSSALVAILNRNGVRPSTFSIVFREADYSEAEFSRAIAQQFHTDHHEITVSQSDFFTALIPAIRAMDLPTIDGINTYFVSQQTRAAGVKVALSALGGDEVFAGYSTFRTVPRLERFAHAWQRLPHPLRNSLAGLFAILSPSNDQNRKLAALARDGARLVHPYFLSRMLFTPAQQDALLPAKIKTASQQKLLADILAPALRLDPINRVSNLEARCYMLNTLLRDSDSMSMAHGLELRVPLLDHHLLRRLLALPGLWKLNAHVPKPLLVGALRGELPDKIVHRPKRGFTLPFEHWLQGAFRPVLEETLHRIADGPLGSMISPAAARAVWQDFLAGRTSWSRPWSIYVLQCWCEQHLSN